MQYPFMIFDWGDTIMKDDPTLDTPMYQWSTVEAIDGAEEVLSAIHSHRTVVMATSADQSNEAEIRLALQRVSLHNYFDRIFCFKNTGLRKTSEDFYRYILDNLGAKPSDALMVGDNFENDVLRASNMGLHAVWLNQKDGENKKSILYETIHSLRELLLILD